jgi:peptidoglycan/xylan/chitin deacetylase (PgdA/CDA1 family)
MKNKKITIIIILILILSFVGIFAFIQHKNNKSIALLENNSPVKKEEKQRVNRFDNIEKSAAAKDIPVLMYHDIISEDDKSDGNKMPVKVFNEQMQFLKENGYATITNEEFIAAYDKKINLPEKSVLITFDDGFKSIKTLVEPILQKHDFRATSFIIGSYINREQWHLNKNEINDISSRKIVNFESHTYDLHQYKNKRGLIETTNSDDFKTDNLKQVDLLGHKTNIVCYPFGHGGGNAVNNLKDSDIPFGFAITSGSGSNTVLSEDRKNELDQTQDPRNLPRVRINADTTIDKFKQLVK